MAQIQYQLHAVNNRLITISTLQYNMTMSFMNHDNKTQNDIPVLLPLRNVATGEIAFGFPNTLQEMNNLNERNLNRILEEVRVILEPGVPRELKRKTLLSKWIQ
ncbi:hypothetical protein QQX98_007040 [Neonectria punicea]|uniref:Uncharacterized protein n=1 Tax=Neonectria punicea TaxID=979145 RepID=A0ABR1GZC9_9HYPO